MKHFRATQFALFRIVFGIYLTVHFLQLLPFANELFSCEGMIADARSLPAYGVYPNLLFYFDKPYQVNMFVITLILFSLCFTFGVWRRFSAGVLFYGWTCLLNRNIFITNPGLAYVGWLLPACVLIEPGESLRKKDAKQHWEVSNPIFYGSILIMNLGYTVSGIHKLLGSSSWIDGSALLHVLNSVLVRDSKFISGFVALVPDIVLKYMTWISLFGECSALFLGCFYHCRKWYWMFFMMFHLGILMTINFSDLTFGMLMIHLFTFESNWFQCTQRWFGQERKFDDCSKPIVNNSLNFVVGSKDLNKNTRNESDHHFIGFSILAAIFASFAFVQNDLFQSSMELYGSMFTGMIFICGICAITMVLEQLYPDQDLKPVKGWWKWVIWINAFQIFTVVLSVFTWEKWLQNTNYFKSSSGFHLRDHVSPFWGGFIAYIVNEFLFYWWHLARHVVYPLWILTHQFHHSPSRIEAITSFYKHPVEIVLDSQIMAILLYAVLGLSAESSIWLSVFSACGEFIYHMNVKTPVWFGYIFQRPESHRCHHRRNKRDTCTNYSALPLFDILGGTFENPAEMNEPTGFFVENEVLRWDMIKFQDVLKFGKLLPLSKRVLKYLGYSLAIFGCLNSAAFLVHNDNFKPIGFMSVCSPLPLVFSHFQGIETFATNFNVTVNPSGENYMLNSTLYSKIKGPYNRRNVYGAMFSHGPFFDQSFIPLRDEILFYGLCKPGKLQSEFDLPKSSQFHIVITSKSQQQGQWFIDVNC